MGRVRLAAAASGERLRRWARLPLRWLEKPLPEWIRHGGGDALRRGRVLVGFGVALFLLGLETVIFFAWTLPPRPAVAVAGTLALAFGLGLGGFAALRRSGSLALATNLMLAASALAIIAVIAFLGGIRSILLHWLALLPMLAMLLGARRSAWAWTGFSVAALLVLIGLDAFGPGLPDYLGPALEPPRLWIQRSVDFGSWLAILVATGWLYESNKDRQTAELAAANAELRYEIDQRRRAERRTHFLAYYDELTRLPNRQLFQERLSLAMHQARRSGRQVAVLFLDLDGFKEVNDTHGHALGDLMLRKVAERLLGCVRAVDAVARAQAGEGELVSRLGGDEFTVLLVDIRSADEAAIVARRILHALEAPFELEGHELYISASIGIAVFPEAGSDVGTLLRNADVAMYHAKTHGKRRYEFFDPAMNQLALRRSTLANELRGAVAGQELRLEFQPILDARSGRIVAAEALLRWQHPSLGLIAPGDFIDVAERTGLIVSIGDWVIHRACRQLRSWLDQGVPWIRVGVNVSSLQFHRQYLVESVLKALAENDLDPGALILEVTESAMMDDEEEARRALLELRRRGVWAALDDFGTGFSSLSHLRRFPFNALKIDRSFVGDVVTNRESQVIVTAIIAMAHEMGLRVVAEGVETVAQERLLRERGCDELQGFLFGRPTSGDRLAERLLRLA